MARLPGAEDLGRVVPQSRQGAPSYRTVDTGQGAMAGALMDAAGAANQVVDKMAMAEAENAFNDARRKELEWQDKYKSIKGTNAADDNAFKAIEEERRAYYENQKKTLSPRAKQRFEGAADRLGLSFTEGVMSHRRREADVARDQSFQGTLETETELGGRQWADRKAVDTSAASIREAINAREKEGLPKPAADALRINSLSRFHGLVATQALANKDIAYAKQYIKDNDSEIVDPKVRTALHENLLRAEKEVEVDKQFVAIENLPESQALRVISRIPDKEVRAGLKSRYSDVLAAKKAEEDDALNPTRTLLGDADSQQRMISRKEQESVLTPLRSYNPQLYDKAASEIYAHNEKVRADQDQARRRADELSSGGSDAVWYALKTDPAMLRATDLMALKDKRQLSDKHFKNLVEDQQALIGKSRSEKENTILSDKNAVDLVLKGAKIATGDKGDAALLGKFYERFDSRVKRLGDNPTQQQKIDVARELLQEVAVERTLWFDGKKRVFEIEGTESIVVPSAEAKKIGEYLKSKGKPVNESNIRELYLETLK